MSRLILILFIFFSAIISSLGAMQFSRLLISKSSGLAGGAEVLGYGLCGLIAGIVGALVLKNRLSPKTLKTATLIMALGSVAAFFWIGIKVNSEKTPVDMPITPKQETNSPDRM